MFYARRKYIKELSINDQKIEAIINTGSDLCLMREDQYIRIDAPKLEKKTIQFHSIDLGEN